MTYLTPTAVAVTVLVLLALGMSEALLTRLVAWMYPKGHPRRDDVLAEGDYRRTLLNLPDRFVWLGGELAAGLTDGVRPRLAHRLPSRRRLVAGLDFAWSAAAFGAATLMTYDAVVAAMGGGASAVAVAVGFGLVSVRLLFWVREESRRFSATDN